MLFSLHCLLSPRPFNLRIIFDFFVRSCNELKVSILKKTLLLFSFFLVISTSIAQVSLISANDMKNLRKKEDSLKVMLKNSFLDSLTAGRMRNDSLFIRTFVRSLQVKNSFYFPFDSVQGMSKIFAPDSSFKIFTWHLDYDGAYIRQRGAIQFKTPDGSLRLVPLTDYSEFADNPMDSVRTKDTWIGAVYYNIIKTTYNGRNFYTLFGYDANSMRSNKKWIEVLTFNEKNLPVFGGPFFSFEKDSVKRPTQFRYGIEYKKDASTMVNYDPELGLILVDHLVSESDEPDNPWTLIPDGDYVGFKWVNGKWLHINKVFDQVLQDGEFPMPDPIRDNQGNANELKLMERSNKNKEKDKKKKDN
jgi:hypothetical protein